MEASGGSAANTIAGIAALGGKAAYIGKVADDQLGEVFTHDIRAVGVTYDTPPLTGGLSTARCLIFVTPDAQRTMQTFLGATTQLGPEDVNMDYITLVEGGLPRGLPVGPAAREEGDARRGDRRRKERRRQGLADAVGRVLRGALPRRVPRAGRAATWTSCSRTRARSCRSTRPTNFDEALQQVRGHCEIAALTRSEKGSVVVNGDEVHVIDAVKGVKVVDTTGAGDAYAAGFLYAYTQGRDLATAAGSAARWRRR